MPWHTLQEMINKNYYCKGDLPFMYSCVFWCEFILALVKKLIYITHSYRESGTPVLGEAILDLVKKKSAS